MKMISLYVSIYIYIYKIKEKKQIYLWMYILNYNDGKNAILVKDFSLIGRINLNASWVFK